MGEKVTIPAETASLVKVRTEGNWYGDGFGESIPPEDQQSGRRIVPLENACCLTRSDQAVYVENNAER